MFYKLLAIAAVAATATPAVQAAKPAQLNGATMSYHGNGRFCLTDRAQRTGTRLPRVECRTSAQWLEDGLTVSLRRTGTRQAAKAPKASSQPVSLVGPAGLEPAT